LNKLDYKKQVRSSSFRSKNSSWNPLSR